MRALLLSLLVIPLAFSASASHGIGRCGGSSGPMGSLGIIELGAGDPSLTFYVEDRSGLFLGNGVWVYQESNGVYRWGASAHDNLQRGGEAVWSSSALPDNLRDREICTDISLWGPDTLIY